MKKCLFISTIVISILLFFSCGMFTTTHKELKKETDKIFNTKTKQIVLASGKRIRTVITNNGITGGPTLVFVHGAPGDSKAFLKYHEDASLQKKFRIISYDRPGYGYKDGFKNGTTLEEQAEVLREVLDSLEVTKANLFAHSFGGAVALELAADYPDRVNNMVLAACAVDPKNEKYFWFGKLGKWKATKWALPKQLRVSGDEKYAHVEELEKLELKLNKVIHNVFVIHGNGDGIVPFVNLTYLETQLVNANLVTKEMDEENHFLVWKKFDFFKDLLLNKLLETSK